MGDLAGFRAAVREHRRAAGRTQQQLARAIGLHPDVLSHKLNRTDNALLTTRDVVGIVTTLAGWGALTTREEAEALLESAAVPSHAIPATAWAAPPLAALQAPEDGPGRVPPQPPAPMDASPAPAEPEAAPPRLSPAPLPAPATALIGRERERAEIAAALSASRLVTLTGAGGAGKTRLALHVASDVAGRFADGVAFIDLAPVSEPALLATAIAAALGLSPPTTSAAEGYVTGALRGKHLLLVVDNLEQLVEGAPLLGRMLAAAPQLRILATSRIALRLYGEHTLRVPPLRLPGHTEAPVRDSEAVQLFVARAQAASPSFAPGPGELTAIGAICTAVDGLPLAIELAAARVRLYPPQALLPMLHSRLTLLTGGPRDLPHRQQTLRATLDWSHALLAAPEQQLFAFLGVFAGPFDAAAARVVSAAQDQATMLEQLADLADQGLLEITTAQTPSFRMLQTVREYAQARLAETGEQNAARQRHLVHYLSVAAAAHASLEGPHQAEALAGLELAYPNLRAALEFAWTQAGRNGTCLNEGLSLATALWYLWERRGPLAEGLLHLDRLLALDDAHHTSAPQVRASAMLAAGRLACLKGDYPYAAELARQCAERFTPLDDHDGLAWAYLLLGEAEIAVGNDDAAETHYQRAFSEASQAGNVGHQAEASKMLGEIARHRGDFRRSGTLLGQAMQLCQAADHPGAVTTVLASLGELARDEGQPRQARRFYHAALRRAAVTGNKRQLAYDLEGFAAAAALDHASREALVYLGAAQALREETGGPLPPVEQAVLTRILASAFAALPAQQCQDAVSEGRNEPLSAIISRALNELPAEDLDDTPGVGILPEVPDGG